MCGTPVAELYKPTVITRQLQAAEVLSTMNDTSSFVKVQ
jgi:hypothetical protein